MDKKPTNITTWVLVLLLVGAAFAVGSMWTKIKSLEQGKKVAGETTAKEAGLAKQKPGAKPVAYEIENIPPLTEKDHIRGDKDAPLTLIEYSDLECPFCKKFHSTMQQILREYKGRVKWAYRHYPLAFHQNAQKEAEASECANEQGGNDKFWEYIDKILEKTASNGTGFALSALAPLAEELGLDKTRFQECLDSDKYAQHVKDEMEMASKAGVEATPATIILNKDGKAQLVSGALPFEQIKLKIEAALE